METLAQLAPHTLVCGTTLAKADGGTRSLAFCRHLSLFVAVLRGFCFFDDNRCKRQCTHVGRCANGADDDLFWMYFTVASDSTVAPNVINGNMSVSDSTVGDDSTVGGSDSCITNATPGVKFVASGVEDGRLAGSGGGGGGCSGVRGMEQRPNGGIEDCINMAASTEFATATRLTVVSNDEMRNHRMALLEPVPFRRCVRQN